MRYCQICKERTNHKRHGDILKLIVSLFGLILFPFGLLLWLVWFIPTKFECTKCGNFIK